MWSGDGVRTTLVPKWSVMITDHFEPMWFPPLDPMVHQNSQIYFFRL